ncbi:hypothetical protein U1763_17370 [Sphingomonas sp. LB2R24]|uniref:hypothetical protein n=1 Tax=Sphingomonas sorbitolis TaxID=3096165 RepID=UPI002FC827B3
MPNPNTDVSLGVQAVALAGGAAAAGIIALCLELVQAGVLPAAAAGRIRDIMVDDIGRLGTDAERSIKRDISAAIRRGFDWTAPTQE